jgi:hypothetical protein
MISKDKQYKTKEGQEVRIYAIDGEGYWPIHGAIKTKEGWEQNCWKKDGGFNYNDNRSELNLIEIVPKVKVWVEYWLDERGSFKVSKYYTKEEYLSQKSRKPLTHLQLDVFEYEPKPETK